MLRAVILAFVAASACGGEKSPTSAAGSGSASAVAPPAPAPAAPDPVAELVQLEAKWQHLAKDGPGDAFCKLGPDLASVLAKAVTVRTTADPAWKGRKDADYAEAAIRKFPGDCNDAIARMGRAAMAHILLSHAFTLDPLPYDVPADIAKKLDTIFAANAPPTTDPAEGLKIVTADVDAVCACKDTTCALDAAEKAAGHIMSMQDLKWTRELMDKLKAQSKRNHDCMEALRKK